MNNAIEWRQVVGYEGLYEVSNTGLVKRIIKDNDKLLKNVKTNIGYYKVCLSKNGKIVQKYVHSLVANAFLGQSNTGFVIDHKDNNRINNYLHNLEYVSQKENSRRGQNCKLKKDRTCKSIGVVFSIESNKFETSLVFGGSAKRTHFTFSSIPTEDQASQIYSMIKDMPIAKAYYFHQYWMENREERLRDFDRFLFKTKLFLGLNPFIEPKKAL